MTTLNYCSDSAIPASALDEDEDDDDDDDDEIDKETRDDERTGTRYNVSFLIIHARSRFTNPRYSIHGSTSSSLLRRCM